MGVAPGDLSRPERDNRGTTVYVCTIMSTRLLFMTCCNHQLKRMIETWRHSHREAVSLLISDLTTDQALASHFGDPSSQDLL